MPTRRAGIAILGAIAAAVAWALRSLAAHWSTGRGAPVRLTPAAALIRRVPPSKSLRLLVAHEQHLQRVGSDTRLLAVLSTLRSHAAEVSLLVRTAKCNHCRRSPPTAELARLLGATLLAAVPLSTRAVAPPPPAIYEFGGSAALAALLRTHAFDLALVGLWFWYDPQPSFAEVLLPTLRAHAATACSGADTAEVCRPPLLALLSDDAHSERARRLAAEESDPAAARRYTTQAGNLGARQRALFAQSDGVFYLTAADRDADARLRPTRPHDPVASSSSLHVGLLRMAVAADERTPALPIAAAGERTSQPVLATPAAVHIGFVGDGHTPTNALGVQRFVRDGWAAVRKVHPSARS